MGPITLEALRERRKNRIIAALYSTDGEGISGADCERVFSVAGVFGTQEDWDDLSVTWFSRTGGIDFHAKECDSDLREFNKFSHKENRALYKDLTSLICQSKLIGHSMAISLDASKKYFPNAKDVSPYYLCFSHVVMMCGRWAKLGCELGYFSIPQSPMKFTFHHQLKRQFTAGHLYEYLRTMEEWKLHPYLDGEIGFASIEGSAPLQVGDLIAREAMKELDNKIGPVKLPRRQSMRALLETHRFFFRLLGDAELLNLANLSVDSEGKRVQSIL